MKDHDSLESEKMAVNSLMNRMNKRGPRTDPCGTPLEMGRLADILEQYLTTGLRSDRHDLNQETEFSAKLKSYV